jgi:hypothetical protein
LKKAFPILKELGLWLHQQYVQVLRQSTIGKAIAYSLERWERLSAYVHDGQLNIDNNPVENKYTLVPSRDELNEIQGRILLWVL